MTAGDQQQPEACKAAALCLIVVLTGDSAASHLYWNVEKKALTPSAGDVYIFVHKGFNDVLQPGEGRDNYNCLRPAVVTGLIKRTYKRSSVLLLSFLELVFSS